MKKIGAKTIDRIYPEKEKLAVRGPTQYKLSQDKRKFWNCIHTWKRKTLTRHLLMPHGVSKKSTFHSFRRFGIGMKLLIDMNLSRLLPLQS